MTAFKRSQAKYVKGSYKTTNWPEYETGLRQRGCLTVWISEDTLAGWGPPRHGRRKPGGQAQYSNHAIEIAVTVAMVFHLLLRQAEGFRRSLFSLLVLDGRVPDHTTISRRARKLGKLPICAPAGTRQFTFWSTAPALRSMSATTENRRKIGIGVRRAPRAQEHGQC